MIVADFVMSLDNVIAIAGAAEGAGGDHQMPLVIFGLLVSIPIIVWGSQLVIKLMDRFPVIITLGGMLLGWIAGQMVVTDPVLKDWMATHSPYLQYAAPRRSARCSCCSSASGWRRGPVPPAGPAPAAGRCGAAAEPAAARAAGGGRLGERGAGGALRHRRARGPAHPEALDVHLLNVQRPVSGEISRFVPGENLKEYHLEGSEAALAPARALLDAAGLKVQEHRRVGDPASTIAQVAKETGCDLVVMGTRGLGGVAAGLLGSVAQATVAQCGVPVLLVK